MYAPSLALSVCSANFIALKLGCWPLFHRKFFSLVALLARSSGFKQATPGQRSRAKQFTLLRPPRPQIVLNLGLGSPWVSRIDGGAAGSNSNRCLDRKST